MTRSDEIDESMAAGASRGVEAATQALLDRYFPLRTRVVMAVGAPRFRKDGRVDVAIPPDPITSSTLLVQTTLLLHGDEGEGIDSHLHHVTLPV